MERKTSGLLAAAALAPGAGMSSVGYPRGGWSVSHGKRLARKSRNVKANRRAHRG